MLFVIHAKEVSILRSKCHSNRTFISIVCPHHTVLLIWKENCRQRSSRLLAFSPGCIEASSWTPRTRCVGDTQSRPKHATKRVRRPTPWAVLLRGESSMARWGVGGGCFVYRYIIDWVCVAVNLPSNNVQSLPKMYPNGDDVCNVNTKKNTCYLNFSQNAKHTKHISALSVYCPYKTPVA